MPVVASNAYFRGVPPKESGTALAIDWSPDGDKIAAATSGGAVCVWKVPNPDDERVKGRLSPKPALPHVIVGDVGRPQRCVSWVPGSEQTGRDDAGPLSLVASIGHCMATPAVYTLDDPFKPAVGARGLAFSGHGAQLGMDWLPHGAGAVTCSAEGSVRLHDFFDKSAVYNREGDSAGTVNSKAIAWATQGEEARKGKSLEKETELSVRGAWCVGAKSIGTYILIFVFIGDSTDVVFCVQVPRASRSSRAGPARRARASPRCTPGTARAGRTSGTSVILSIRVRRWTWCPWGDTRFRRAASS